MRLTDEEREARDKGRIVIGVAHAGVKNLTGSLISCAVALDYNNIPQDVIDGVLNKKFTKKLQNSLLKTVRVINTHEIDALKLNSISDTNIATYLADYHALYGCVFEVFHKFSTDPDYVISESPIKEVVQNRDLSLYTNKKNKSNYVVMKDWTQFDNLLPNTKFLVKEPEHVFTLLLAKECAESKLRANEKQQQQKYPDYNFNLTSIDEKESKFLREHGLTEYHRAYMPELALFAFNKHILI